MSIALTKIVPWGRSRGEYELMFDLSREDLRGPILGCGDGPASFNAELTPEGVRVISVDPLYQLNGSQIAASFEETADSIIGQVKATPGDWVWDIHGNPDELRHARRRALNCFLGDYEQGRRAGRYVPAALPRLPFANGAFRLALCSHLLFLYSDLLDERFHIQAAAELCRVATEVRIFPLLTLDLSTSRHVDAVRRALESRGITSSIERVGYELQRGGNRMLRLCRPSRADHGLHCDT